MFKVNNKDTILPQRVAHIYTKLKSITSKLHPSRQLHVQS